MKNHIKTFRNLDKKAQQPSNKLLHRLCKQKRQCRQQRHYEQEISI